MQFKSNPIINIILKSLLEFAPVFIFVFAFEMHGFFFATKALILFTLISTIYIYLKDKRVPYFALFVAFTTILFGIITLDLHDPRILQIRDTAYDAGIALTLALTVLKRKLILKTLFGHIFKISDDLWAKVTWLWALYFFVLALMNEFVRHHFHLGIWVYYKMLVIMLTILYGLVQLLIYREELLD